MAAVGSPNATRLAASLLDPIPANRLFGIQVLAAEDGAADVGLDVARDVSNVIGSLHSSGLIALVDTAGLAAIISLAPAAADFDGVVPLGSVARMSFLAPARGHVVARCGLDQEARDALDPLLARQADRATVETEADVRDSDGNVVCRGSFVWKVRRLPAS